MQPLNSPAGGNLSAKAVFAAALFLQSSLFPSLTQARTNARNTRRLAQEQQAQALGSLSKVGDVYVNDSPAPAESTIFMGDKLRTGEDGVASFTVSGRGTLKFSPNSLAVFASTEQYLAELKSGSAVVSSLIGPGGLALRVGDFIVVPAVQGQQTTARVERAMDGSSSVACLEGSASVVSLQGASGQLLQAGQALRISQAGQLIANPSLLPNPSEPAKPAQPEPSEPNPPPTPSANRKGSRKGWIILGVAGGGAAIALAAAAASGGGHQPVSPSSP